MKQNAITAAPIHEILDKRWSPRAMDPAKSISEDEVKQLFEAARWAPSSYNAQPWRYVYAHREDKAAFMDLFQCLMPANQLWAKNASLLIISLAATTMGENSQPNSKALYDTGAANFALTTQATSMDLFVHQMGGFSKDKAVEVLGLEDNIVPVVMLAVGHLGDPELLPEELRARESSKKNRFLAEEFAQNRAEPA